MIEDNMTVFEKIVTGEIPGYKIYEDELTFAFLDISPHSKGHALVIPKTPYPNIYEVDDDVLSALMKTVQKVAVAVKRATDADGVKVVNNNGSAAGQVITDHLHFHVVPMKEGQKWSDRYEYEEGEMEEVAERVRVELG